MKNFIEELTWRGMLHDLTPGAEEHLLKAPRAAYVGIDPTADSLHIGHLVSVMILKHFQACGHRPIVLIGGATGMIGDPSGKSQERNLLTKEQIETNIDGIKAQLSSLLNFDDGASNCARLVNNHDWIAPYSFIGFIRDIGKHITFRYIKRRPGAFVYRILVPAYPSHRLPTSASRLQRYAAARRIRPMG